MRSSGPCLIAALLLAGGLGGEGCGRSPASQPVPKRGAREFAVEVRPVESRRVEYRVTAVGSVEAFEVVQITARVAGVVERVRFVEGEQVSPGQVLVEIEPERYRLTAQSAQANLTKAEATKAEIEASLARREGVVASNPGLIPGEELEAWRTRLRTAEAELSQARAALELAELNLRDALVGAPFAGIVQTRTVQTGQYVQPGAVLATLVRRDPLLLRFQVPEQDASRLRPGMKAWFAVRNDEREFSAQIISVAETADLASRMVAITARVDDPARDQLRPGAFAQISVPVNEANEALVIPQIAVRPSESGFLAYVVEGGVARQRVLSLGMRTADGQVEVRSGLQAGELLVVRGAEALYEGAPVRVQAGSLDSTAREGRS